MELKTDIFDLFDSRWALLTAGTAEDFNNMTISWGGLGTLWSKPVATIYIRTVRHTHKYLDSNEYFTLSFFPAQYRKTLAMLGSKSGRDIDKMHMEGLTPKAVGETVGYEEAELTLVCRRLFRQQIDPTKVPVRIAENFYDGDYPHDMYIGEVVEILS
ncbi:Flavin reductase like domain-containing protein [Ruminococcaceae bacterium YRB3002]|nr:Flavin reductase like domain-containing protein [Ruminococcaceae bacterium YRB3002]